MVKLLRNSLCLAPPTVRVEIVPGLVEHLLRLLLVLLLLGQVDQ